MLGDIIGRAHAVVWRVPERFLWLLTTDFCPWANRWFCWLKYPAAALSAAAVVALVCGVFVNPLALLPAAAILVTLLFGFGWPWIAMRGLTARIEFDHSRAEEGEWTDGRLIVTNSWPLPVWGLSLVGGFGQSNDDSSVVGLSRVGAFATHEFSFRFVTDCRGLYPLETPRLQTGFPFGLRRAERPVVVEEKLLVRPKTFAIDDLLEASETRPTDDFLSEHRVGESGDMLGTRGFRGGDSLRRIHWAQTARYDRLIVCERQASANSALLVQLDLDPAVHRGQGRDGSWEWSIRIAASLCRAYHEQHAHVVCRIGREDICVRPGAAGFQRFLDALARLPRFSEAAATAMTSGSAKVNSWPGLRVVVTTDIGLSRLSSGRVSRGMQRELVLKATAFEPVVQNTANCEFCERERFVTPPGAIVIDDAQQLVQQFRQRWKRVCYAA